MKTFLFGAALFAAAAAPAMAETRVSINIGDPGFFGLIDNRGYAPPPVYVRQPVIIERVSYHREPVYVRAPLRHRQHWRQWCHRYDACNVPVLFVREEWYSNTYAPRVREVYRDRPYPVQRVVYRDRPREVERVVYRDAPRPVVVQKVVYRDRDRDDHRGRAGNHDKHHDKHHDKGHGRGHGRDKD